MTVLSRLALLFVLVPLVELMLLIRVGQWAGLWPTVGLVLLTGVLGAALARREGLRTLRTFQTQVASGGIPGEAILDGMCILLGGVLLLTPGLLTDVVGFAFLLAPSRRWIQRRIRRRMEEGLVAGTIRMAHGGTSAGFTWWSGRGEPAGGSEVVEAIVVEEGPPEPRRESAGRFPRPG